MVFYEAFSGGIAAGSKFRILETTEEDSGQILRLYLDIRARFLLGGEAEYLQEGSISVDNGRMVFDSNYSRTDLMTFHVGITITM